MRLSSLVLSLSLAFAAAAHAADPAPAVPIEIGSGVTYEAIGVWDAARLNAILSTEAPEFFGVTFDAVPAANAVRLYRVTYPSVVPEQGNRPITATGLLAVPDTEAAAFPMLSYQHGTVYGKTEVPSFPDQSDETQLALALFAAQGYVVIGADYFGMGDPAEPEGYLVKASHQQATYDMLMASRAALADMGLASTDLFLGGWSQGGFVTMAMLEKLESAGVAVTAAATASAPVDVFLGLNGFLSFPRPNDASWTTTLFILTAFSFEEYYGVPGLARALIGDDAYATARAVYERTPFDAAQVPTDLRALIREDYFDPQVFADSAYGRLLKDHATAYRWVVRSPVRTYYGEEDEVISPGLGRLAADYQRAMGAGNPAVEAVSTGATDHRGTYATAAPLWKEWFDGLRSAR